MRRGAPTARERRDIRGAAAQRRAVHAAILTASLSVLLLACDAPTPPPDAQATPGPPRAATRVPAPAPTTTATAAPPPAPTAAVTAAPAPAPAAAVAAEPGSPPQRTPARLIIVVAPVASETPRYSRDEWSHWRDDDGDCQDARQEVLIDESRASVRYQSARGCRVESGLWVGPYTGQVFTEPGGLDVDHMVPLSNAHRSGAWAWSSAKKAAYANDLGYENHLIAVQSSANRQKGASGPEDWRPPLRGYWCQYATDWIAIKQRWELTATESELAALRSMLAECAEPPTLTVRRGDAASPGGPVDASATPAPTSGLLFDPAGPDRDCGDFPAWDQAQAFYLAAGGPDRDRHRLDGDGDGVACESLPGAP